MAFSKTFPKTIPGSNYPQWEEIFLTEAEEKEAEELCRKENFELLSECLNEAKSLAIKHAVNSDENRVKLAIALFEKKASHQVYWKEKIAKDKFDAKNKN
ncbi:hypothetical protein J4437_04455 [Candidatus Woesearchaeota archaeon]|nr:hypothetical protein [Candidatus Woesearchaeota archaeon]